MCVLFLPFTRYKKRSSKGVNHIPGIGIEYTSSSTESFLFGISSTTFLKVSAISCKYFYYGWIHITDFSFTLLLVFGALILEQKNIEQNFLVIILHTVCERWNAGRLQGQADCCKQGWFIARNWPVILWLSFIWYGTHTVFEL